MQWKTNTSDRLSKGILYSRKAVCTKPFSCGPSAATQQSFCQCEFFELSSIRFDNAVSFAKRKQFDSVCKTNKNCEKKMQAYESLMKAFLEHNKVSYIFSKVAILFKFELNGYMMFSHHFSSFWI